MEKLNKNFNGFHISLIFLNLILIIGVIGYLIITGTREAKVEKYIGNTAQIQKSGVDKKTEMQDESHLNLKDQEYIVEITDKGFVGTGFQAVGGRKINFTVINNGTKPHSFDIDNLNVSSGAIAPGKTKSFTVESIPNENTNITYRSSIEGDSSDAFTGVLVVIKK
ncbi:MAG: cupredoxin domain-containing protein [Candidatus Paceibacterota bacterium]